MKYQEEPSSIIDFNPHDRFQRLLNMVSIAVVSINTAGTMTFANERAALIFGYPQQEFINKPISMLIPERLRSIHNQHLQNFFDNPHPRPMGVGMDLTAQRKDGTEFPIEVSLSVIETEDGLQGVAFIVDISERRYLQQQRTLVRAQEERIQILQRFVTYVEHDLKTPLASMNTRLYLLKKTLDNPDNPHLKVLEKQIQRFCELVDVMLVMTRLDTIETIETEPTQMDQLLHIVYTTYQAAAEEKGISLIYRNHDESITMLINPFELTDAISALVQNAINYTPENGQIELQATTDDQNYIITVQDNGIGIAPQHIPAIFDRFYRIDEARNTDVGHNGLGLSIAKRIVELHAGTITVESDVDVGSRFCVRLPFDTK